MDGFVSFVSSGPGDPELLTIKALKILKSANVILYDDLSSDTISGLLGMDIDFISVGKRAGFKSPKQNDISKLLVEYAKSGKKVVRLKSGDCSIFGRLEEEILALNKAGIAYEIIPGVSSIFAAMAEAGIPLTRRNESRKVQFLTGHDFNGNFPNDLMNKSLTDLTTTTVIFMAKKNYSFLLDFLIKEGLAKVKYSKDDEEDLYNNLIRSMYASGSALKTTEIGLNEYAEAERLIKDARELNKSYFYNRDLWTYLYLNQNFIEDDLRESKFYKAETSINEAILLINKLNSENYRYHKFGDWKEEKETYLRDYLTMYAQIFFLTGRFKESIDIYEKVVTTYKKRFKKDFGTSDITKIKSASIEKFHLMSTYMNLLKIYNKVGDTKQQKKYVNILYQICKVDGQTIAKALCSSIYREKIEYHKQSNDLDGLIKTIEEIEKFYANFKIVNPYITFLSEQELLQAKMEANILQLKILERKNQSNSTKFKKLNEQGCHFVDQMNQKNTEMSKFIKNKQVSYDFKFRFSTITIGTYFMESGLQCEKKIEDAQIQLSQIDEIINLY